MQRAVIDQERKDNVIQSYVKDSGLSFVDVEVKNVILDDLRQSPYSARIEFEKVFTNPADHSEVKRERWTATVTYVFRENVKNNELAVNPLGLTIVRFRADEAFRLGFAAEFWKLARVKSRHRRFPPWSIAPINDRHVSTSRSAAAQDCSADDAKESR